MNTLSLLDRSRTVPMANVSIMSSLIGNCALFESSASSVVVKTLAIASAGLSDANGVLDRVSRPMDSVAVDDTMRRSWRLGAKSLIRNTVW